MSNILPDEIVMDVPAPSTDLWWIVGVVAGVDEKVQTITLSKPLPASAAGSYLFISDRPDNAYRVEAVVGRAVRVADTAPLHVKPGETFRFVDAARQYK